MLCPLFRTLGIKVFLKLGLGKKFAFLGKLVYIFSFVDNKSSVTIRIVPLFALVSRKLRESFRV